MDFSLYTRRVLIAIGLLFTFIVAMLVLRKMASVLLLLFASVLLAVLFQGLANALSEGTGLSYGWGLTIVVVLLTVIFVCAGWYAGPRVNEQTTELGERIPDAFEYIQSILQQFAWGRGLLASSPDAQQAISFVAGGVTSVIGAVTSGLVVIIIGLYLAADPSTYINGALRLLSPSKRDRGRDVLRVLGHALRWWLVGRLASMAVVGILMALGLWIAGVPLAFVLGLIAGLLSFVPYIGPISSIIPASLVALAESPTMVVYVLIIYGSVELLESNLVTPLIQERTVSIPPAVLISAQVVMGVLFGALGVLIATPLAVVSIVLVQMLYIEDVLGEPVTPLGE